MIDIAIKSTDADLLSRIAIELTMLGFDGDNNWNKHYHPFYNDGLINHIIVYREKKSMEFHAHCGYNNDVLVFDEENYNSRILLLEKLLS